MIINFTIAANVKRTDSISQYHFYVHENHKPCHKDRTVKYVDPLQNSSPLHAKSFCGGRVCNYS